MDVENEGSKKSKLAVQVNALSDLKDVKKKQNENITVCLRDNSMGNL